MNARTLTALVVHESMFHNTAAIADAVADGLTRQGMLVTNVDVVDAPDLDAVDVDLLVVGAPTSGVREWLGAASPVPDRACLAAMFGTRVPKLSRRPTSAGTRGDQVLEGLGFTLLQRAEPFFVDDVKGHLVQGETERAIMWGHGLAHHCQGRLTPTPASG